MSMVVGLLGVCLSIIHWDGAYCTFLLSNTRIKPAMNEPLTPGGFTADLLKLVFLSFIHHDVHHSKGQTAVDPEPCVTSSATWAVSLWNLGGSSVAEAASTGFSIVSGSTHFCWGHAGCQGQENCSRRTARLCLWVEDSPSSSGTM